MFTSMIIKGGERDISKNKKKRKCLARHISTKKNIDLGLGLSP